MNAIPLSENNQLHMSGVKQKYDEDIPFAEVSYPKIGTASW